jgi:hypothetical protein
MSEERRVQTLFDQLVDSDAGSRCSAAEGIRRLIEYDSEVFKKTDVVQRLLKMVTADNDHLCRVAASFAIAQMAKYDPKQIENSRNTLTKLIAIGAEDQDALVKKNIFEGLANIAENSPTSYNKPQSVVDLISIKRDSKSVKDRFEAARVLRNLYESLEGKLVLKGALRIMAQVDPEGTKEFCKKSKWSDLWREIRF